MSYQITHKDENELVKERHIFSRMCAIVAKDDFTIMTVELVSNHLSCPDCDGELKENHDVFKYGYHCKDCGRYWDGLLLRFTKEKRT